MKWPIKFYVLLSLSFFFFQIVSAQIRMPQDVPDLVKKAFHQKYPKAENIDWDTSSSVQDGFLVDFTINKEKFNSTFDSAGIWVETSSDVEKLPDAIMKTIGAKFPDAEVSDAEMVATPLRPKFYRAKIEKSAQERWEVSFLENGIVIEQKDLNKED